VGLATGMLNCRPGCEIGDCFCDISDRDVGWWPNRSLPIGTDCYVTDCFVKKPKTVAKEAVPDIYSSLCVLVRACV
jgi:hypothetical protein